jgi:hypothetical protein
MPKTLIRGMLIGVNLGVMEGDLPWEVQFLHDGNSP